MPLSAVVCLSGIQSSPRLLFGLRKRRRWDGRLRLGSGLGSQQQSRHMKVSQPLTHIPPRLTIQGSSMAVGPGGLQEVLGETPKTPKNGEWFHYFGVTEHPSPSILHKRLPKSTTGTEKNRNKCGSRDNGMLSSPVDCFLRPRRGFFRFPHSGPKPNMRAIRRTREFLYVTTKKLRLRAFAADPRHLSNQIRGAWETEEDERAVARESASSCQERHACGCAEPEGSKPSVHGNTWDTPLP